MPKADGGYDPLMVFRFHHSVLVAVASLLMVLAVMSAWGTDAGSQQREQGSSQAQMLVSASGGQRLWFVRPPVQIAQEDQPRLLHHAVGMGGPYFSRGPGLIRMPEALAASGDRVWMVFPPQEFRDELRREVHTLRMVRDPALGMYQPEPRDRLELAEALPGWGRLAGFAAGDGQVAALILPLEHETFSVQRDGKETPSKVRTPQLWQMRSSRWEQVALPDGLTLGPHDPVLMAFDGLNGDRLNVLTSAGDADRSMLLRRDQGGTWTTTLLDVDPRAARLLITVEGRLAVVTVADNSTATLHYVRDKQLLKVAQLDLPRAGTSHWTIAGLDDGFHLLTHTARDQLLMQHVDGVTGQISPVVTMTDQPLPAAKLWHTGLMLAVSIIAVIIVLMVRPGTRGEVQLPKHTAILPAVPRLVALLIDLTPGAIIAIVITRAAPADLLRIPMMADTLDQAGPHLIMLGITFLQCTIFEMLSGTSFGKMLVGAGVVTTSGVRPRAMQVLIRNAVKLMVLLVPPLAVFALLNPYMQGFNDMAAGTLVVREVASDDEE